MNHNFARMTINLHNYLPIEETFHNVIILIYMLYFNRNDVSEWIDVNKRSALKECDVCHYLYFLNKGFNFQPNVCNRCHDLLIMTVNLSDIAILNINGSDHSSVISGISENVVWQY